MTVPRSFHARFLLLPLLVTQAITASETAPVQKPENVLVVVNRSSKASRRIAEYYVAKRAIPMDNVCTLKTTTDEEIDRETYEKEIARPVAACIQAKQLREKILYIVTTLGVPLKVSAPPEKDQDHASVDSELTLLYAEIGGPRFPRSGPLPNPFFGRRDEAFTHPRFPIYLVTRLAGYDFDEVKGIIDRSLEAQNRGRFVLDMKSSDDEMGNNWLRTAAMLLPKDRVLFDESTHVVTGEHDVIGYAGWGSNDPSRKQRFLGLQWLPGAIATEYVSENGRTFSRPPNNWAIKDPKEAFAGSTQSLTADYIHEGATGASGHVYEPYLDFTPRPDYVLPAYFSGRTLAESFYLGIKGVSWTNIVIGDPLCRLGKPK